MNNSYNFIYLLLCLLRTFIYTENFIYFSRKLYCCSISVNYYQLLKSFSISAAYYAISIS